MPTQQHPQGGKVYLHPTTCTRPAVVDAFQRRTGLRLIVSPAGLVRAVPAGGYGVSEYTVPLKRVMLLQKALENGGTTTCPLRRPETTSDALIEVENDTSTHHIRVIFGPLTGSLTLQRGDSSKYMALRDFLEELANGRADSGRLSQQAIALMEAQDCVNSVIEAHQIAYVIQTVTPARPFGAVVTDGLGTVHAAVTGTCKHHLAEAVRAQLRPHNEGHGEHP